MFFSRARFWCWFLLLGIPVMMYGQNTAELLGYDDQARLLIINADDFGMCHAENLATMNLLRSGGVTSTTVMTPCPWFPEVADFYREHPEIDIGAHLTLNAEWTRYKWGSVAPGDRVSSLLNPSGFFYSDVLPVEQNAKPKEVRTEFIAQIEKAQRAGIQLSHIDNHMGSAYGLLTGRDFLDVVFQLSAQYNLPFRLPRHADNRQGLSREQTEQFQQLTEKLVGQGFVLPDYLITVDHAATQAGSLDRYKQMFRDLKPGVTELYIHAAIPTDEMKAISGAWEHRAFDYHIFSSPETRAYLDSLGIKLIGWKALQTLQKETVNR